tara:strand:- start:376 stop:477 length:102 start_codon:yes stop_codon:yes gene_type:complete
MELFIISPEENAPQLVPQLVGLFINGKHAEVDI